MSLTSRQQANQTAIHRSFRKAILPKDSTGKPLAVTEYFGENAFDVFTHKSVSADLKKKLVELKTKGTPLAKEDANAIAKAASDWAISKGCTHFCHWFQPLTGSTAEKHDAFLTYDSNGYAIQKLSGSQLMQGEPDASSFPNGGARSTFEARGYTSWDVTSPLFIKTGTNGKTLCIPTAFVSYTGEALDIKTPLLRSVSRVNQVVTSFLNTLGDKDVTDVTVTCGAEQEYFLVDKAHFYSRPDLVMGGRAVFGMLPSRNQQLDDHYFGLVPDRVLAFMQELEVELYGLGVPAKTRHNEVAPGQFELAAIYQEANVAADQNQLIMATIKKVAGKHNFVALLHEKPFAGINGSGKHLNWSMADNLGRNLLEPGEHPEDNERFLAFVAMITEALNRHASVIRTSIGSHGNDHRLGANEAPPSIISVFLGDTITKIFDSIMDGSDFRSSTEKMDMGINQLVSLLKDNTDRNRTSPFAFTGNKFEFRAVGSSAAVGYPLAILNAAVADVVAESTTRLQSLIDEGKSSKDALTELTRELISKSRQVIFNGDGYSDDWVKEAESRGLPNLRTTADALETFKDENAVKFLLDQEIFRASELEMRYNVLIERYITHREIELNTLALMVDQYVLPAAINYKHKLAETIDEVRDAGASTTVEKNVLKNVSLQLEKVYDGMNTINSLLEAGHGMNEDKLALKIANEILPLSEEVADACNRLEQMIPDRDWELPKVSDMLFVR